MTDSDYTHLAFLLDRSGSMQTIKADTEGGFDAFIEEQKAQPGRCTVTLAQFDHDYETVYTGVPLEDAPPLRLQPRGRTALLDSLARLIHETGAHLAGMPEQSRPGTVIVGVMTDGMENASVEHTHAAIKSLIESQEGSYGWTFTYLGAGQDAIEEGAKLGVAASRSLTYTGANVADAMGAYSSMTAGLRSAVADGKDLVEARAEAGYTQAQRKAATR